jgi:NAD(P)-dependent dehydrogenase (short-subunit alcohol dehydrogenase family)
MSGFVDFNPDKDIGLLTGKVIFITGGTAGLGRASVLALARHGPAHIYFSGRRAEAAESLMAEVKDIDPAVGATFLMMNMLSLTSVKAACQRFTHDRLDLLMCNAGIMAVPPALSEDGFEIQFATNHLAHSMVVHQLLPVLLRTAERPGADVRVITLTSLGYQLHPKAGVLYDKLRTPIDGLFGSWVRYG